MTTRRAEILTDALLNDTVIKEWFEPMKRALESVRFSDRIFCSLPMVGFALLGGLRQVLNIPTLREHVQTWFHWDEGAQRLPIPRSTFSDAMRSTKRRDIMRQAIVHLVSGAQTVLTDKMKDVHGLGERPVIAIDATYQTESSHYQRVLPKQGGEDNQKGHMLLTYYDIRHGIPLGVYSETKSMGERRVLRQMDRHNPETRCIRGAIYVVDRAFIHGRYWDACQRQYKATVITRMKSTLSYTRSYSREVAPLVCNEQVLSDQVIQLASSKQPWRLIQWRSPDDIEYEYLTNELTLEPGVIAFVYYRRWDEEKYFDNFKNDLANIKAWGKSAVAIEQQVLIGLMTYVLTQLFLQRQYQELNLVNGDATQRAKQARKVQHYQNQKVLKSQVNSSQPHPNTTQQWTAIKGQYDYYRAYYAQLSKITRQVWRFLKNCFDRKSSPELYQRHLRPLLVGYL